MIEGRGVVTIMCTREALIAFVTDLEQYKRADLKIGRVYSVVKEGALIRMRHGGTLRGMPGPPVRLVMLVDDSGAHYQSDGGIARLFLTFDGGFDVDVVPGGVRVTHVERFRFHFPWRIVAEPLLRTWLQRDVEAEVLRMKALLER